VLSSPAQGEFAGDVLFTRPKPQCGPRNAYSAPTRNSCLRQPGKSLGRNGYDFDPVNDDVLQNRARVEGGRIKVRDLAYRFLILPKTTAVPVATMEFIRKFALGGGVVIALDELPATSVGLKDAAPHDARVKQIVSELFGPTPKGRFFPAGAALTSLPITRFRATTRTSGLST